MDEPVPIPPAELRTARLLLRRWRPTDAPALRDALRDAWADLQRWIPWVFADPEDLAALEERLRAHAADFDGGGNALYALVDPATAEIVGGAGLYRRVGPGALEIGYWIRTGRAGQGLATEVAGALTATALALPGIRRVEIRCDPAHEASWRVARRLGYRHHETLPPAPPAEGRPPRATMIWTCVAPAEPHTENPETSC